MELGRDGARGEVFEDVAGVGEGEKELSHSLWRRFLRGAISIYK